MLQQYYLKINEEVIEIGSGLGSDEEENKAKEVASLILKDRGINFNIKDTFFKWNGCL